jgi:hypothetical protein
MKLCELYFYMHMVETLVVHLESVIVNGHAMRNGII